MVSDIPIIGFEGKLCSCLFLWLVLINGISTFKTFAFYFVKGFLFNFALSAFGSENCLY